MKLKKLKLTNFKQFRESEFEFNDDINIIVGDNDSGKTTLLEAIEIVLTGMYRGKPLSMQLSPALFTQGAIQDYLKSDKAQDKLPELRIEAFLKGNSQLKGNNNQDKTDTEGISVRIFFDDGFSTSYQEFTKEPDSVRTLPLEFYKIEWFTFAWDRVSRRDQYVSCLFVDPLRLHPSFGRTQYINSIINAALDKESRSKLNLNYRQLQSRFDDEDEVIEINKNLDPDNVITEKVLQITAEISSATSWESSLGLAIDNIPFEQIGKGEQSQIQIKLALAGKTSDVHITMFEEPENHLSHINLVKLISYIKDKTSTRQMFISTHSSYVLNKLDISKLCLLVAGNYAKLDSIPSRVIKRLQRLPGYDTLRVILSKKVVLVEGPSDEIILKKIYVSQHSRLPEEDGIDIVVVRGVGFKNYLEIAKGVKQQIRVVKDNDGNYEKNIKDWGKDLKMVTTYSPTDNSISSLEPALIDANSQSEDALDKFAEIALSRKTYKLYSEKSTVDEKRTYLTVWFSGEKTGAKKVDSAMRIFDSSESITYPEYLCNAIKFDT